MTWYVVAHPLADDSDKKRNIWTLSKNPTAPGWNTNEATHGYGLSKHCHGMAVHGTEDGSSDNSIWDMLDEPFVHAAIGMIYCMLPGHEQSKGMARERDQFIADKKDIVYMHAFIVPQALLDFRARQVAIENDISFYVRHSDTEWTKGTSWVETNREQLK